MTTQHTNSQTASKAIVTKRLTTGESGLIPAATTTLTHDQIAARAYEIWRSNGQPHGRDQDDWFKAIADLSGKTSS